MENYGDLQLIARNIKPTLWVPGQSLSFGLFPNYLKYHHRTQESQIAVSQSVNVLVSRRIVDQNFHYRGISLCIPFAEVDTCTAR